MPLTQLCVSRLGERYPQLKTCESALIETINTLEACFNGGGKLLLVGNGGSAADADHIVAELMMGFVGKRPLNAAQREMLGLELASLADHLQGSLPAIQLGASSALMSAYGNDVDWEYAYAQQLWGLARAGDVLLAISTSGNSANIIHAARLARRLGVTVVGLTGARASALTELASIVVGVPASEVHQVQEWHVPVYHALCMELEALIFPAV